MNIKLRQPKWTFRDIIGCQRRGKLMVTLAPEQDGRVLSNKKKNRRTVRCLKEPLFVLGICGNLWTQAMAACKPVVPGGLTHLFNCLTPLDKPVKPGVVGAALQTGKPLGGLWIAMVINVHSSLYESGDCSKKVASTIMRVTDCENPKVFGSAWNRDWRF